MPYGGTMDFICICEYRIQYACAIWMGNKSTSEINKIYKLPVPRSQISVKLPLNKLHTTHRNLTKRTAASNEIASVANLSHTLCK